MTTPASRTSPKHLLPVVVPARDRDRLTVQEPAKWLAFLRFAVPVIPLLQAECRVLVPEYELGQCLATNELAHESGA